MQYEQEIIEDLSLLTDQGAISRISDSLYMTSYRALIALAAEIEDDPKHDNLLALACAAYGWMPTILKSFAWSNSSLSEPIRTLRSVSSSPEAKKILDQFSAHAPVNGSWIGTSKLLHFLNVDHFPIWDSRIAIQFGMKHHFQFNRRDVYIQYIHFMHTLAREEFQWIEAMQGAVSKKYSYTPSRIRCIEMMIFERTSTST